MYYRAKLHSNAGNLKQTWKTLNELMNKKSNINKIPEIKDEKGEIIDEARIPDVFNKYFVELGEKLANKIPDRIFCRIVFLVMYTIQLMASQASKKFLKMMF